jgi:uncharacterized protein (UPF0335 family)
MNDAASDMNPQTAQQLKSIIERIERLEEEKKALAEDIKEVSARSCRSASRRPPSASSRNS